MFTDCKHFLSCEAGADETKTSTVQPILSQAAIHRLIEHAITTTTVVSAGKCSDVPKTVNAIIRRDSDSKDKQAMSRSNSCSDQCKSGTTGLVEIGSRQTLQEINPKKQLTECVESQLTQGNLSNVGMQDISTIFHPECDRPSIEVSRTVQPSVTGNTLFVSKNSSTASTGEIKNKNCILKVNSDKCPVASCGQKLAVRKSNRCNRGKRYQEMLTEGVLHQSKKRPDIM